MPVKLIFIDSVPVEEEVPVVKQISWATPEIGPWDFIEQGNKWGYLNNPRWMQEAGDPVNFTGREDDEPQVWPMKANVYSKENIKRHMPCGHWHKGRSGFEDLIHIYGTYDGNVVEDFVVAASFNILTETLTYEGYHQTSEGKHLQAIDLYDQSDAVVVIEDIEADAKLLLVSQKAVNGILPVVGREEPFSQFDVLEGNGGTIVHTALNYYVVNKSHRLLKLGSDLSPQLSGYTGMVVDFEGTLYVLTYIPIIGNPFNFPPNGESNTYWTYIPDQATDSKIYAWPQLFGFAARGEVRMFVARGELNVSENASPFDENKVFDSDLGVVLRDGYRNGNNGPTLVVANPYAYNVDRGITSWGFYQMNYEDWEPTGEAFSGEGFPINSGYAMIYYGFYIQTHAAGMYTAAVHSFLSLADNYSGPDVRHAIIPLNKRYFAVSGTNDIYVYYLNLDGTIRFVDSIELSSFGPPGFACRGLVAKIP